MERRSFFGKLGAFVGLGAVAAAPEPPPAGVSLPMLGGNPICPACENMMYYLNGWPNGPQFVQTARCDKCQRDYKFVLPSVRATVSRT